MSKTAIIEAVKTLDLEATQRLLNGRPALLNVRDGQDRTLLQLACSASCREHRLPETQSVRLASTLLNRGLAIDEPVGRDRCTPLFFAVARARNPTLVKFLIDRGANVNAAPGGGLFAAGWWDDIVNLGLLIDAGARIDIVVGVTPFLACWCWKRFEAAKVLALRGADVNYRDKKGRTALYHGVEKQYDPSLLHWLVLHGASPEIAADDGVSPRLKASRKRDKRFLAALSP
jgi:ankyrin repeat protein